MTPALAILKQAGIPHEIHEYDHDPTVRAFGDEAAAALGLESAVVFKTLIAGASPRDLVVAVVPVAAQLDLKALATVMGVKRMEMADVKLAERQTGYIVGGISPLGQKRPLPTVVDTSALDHERIYVSGGRRGLDVSLAPAALVEILDARTAAIART